MKQRATVAWIAATASLTLALAPAAGAAVRVDPPAWSDEFDSSSLDAARWSHRSSGPRWDGVLTPDAVTVGGGALTIRTYTENATHYSGMISTQPGLLGTGFEQTYGQFEARVRFDSAPGQWSAFWLQSPTMGALPGDPGTSGVEMDIAEHRARCVSPPTPGDVCGGAISDRIQHALIWDGYAAGSKAVARLSDPLGGLTNGSWHTWALRWTPTDVVFLYDDAVVWSVTGPIARRSEYVVLSSEVGQFFAGQIPAGGYGTRATSTTKLQVDWVRVWQTTTPLSTAAPVASGSAAVGETVACSMGAWSGSPAPAFAYAWLRDGATIAGATDAAHPVASADGGHGLTCRVTATNSAGSASAISNALAVAAPPAPPPLPPPLAQPPPPTATKSLFLAAPAPPAADTAPPDAVLLGSTSQRVASTVRVRIACRDEDCLATTAATVRVPRLRRARARTFAPTAVTRAIAAGATATVAVRLSATVRRAIAGAARAGNRVAAVLRVRVADRAGNARTLVRRIAFRR